MLNQPKVVRYYETSPGVSPAMNWLNGLPDRLARSRLRVRLRRLECGNPGAWRPVGGGVLELKADFGPGYRLYIAEDGPVLVLLLLGGDKSTQAVDIRTAQGYWARYRAGRRRDGHA